MVKIIAEDLPTFPIHYHPDITIARKGLEGPGPRPAIQRASAANIHLWELR
jgi:hypothetical protein